MEYYSSVNAVDVSQSHYAQLLSSSVKAFSHAVDQRIQAKIGDDPSMTRAALRLVPLVKLWVERHEQCHQKEEDVEKYYLAYPSQLDINHFNERQCLALAIKLLAAAYEKREQTTLYILDQIYIIKNCVACYEDILDFTQ